ncbi:MAG: UvrD-helicase domain-containing protein, partial [Lachnospiraceae bacterium]|nr:UvrD-helicase domain-containing protein [Lachnospiraceae bacterium]
MKYTPEQQKVIDLRNKNIIVSAAAGSGKTAVLTERIASKICDSKNPSSIDKMLIVTFTNAAAGEMRDRIGKKLRERLAENPDNTYIRKQIAILHTAQITTIDSFCLYILKNHFEEIGVDPAFRIANEGEKTELLHEAFDETIEESFERGDEEFLNLVEMYAPKGKFSNLRDMVFELARASESTLYPYDTLEGFITDGVGDVWNSPFVKFLIEYENNFLKAALASYKKAAEILEGTDLLKHIGEVNTKISFIEGLLESDFAFRLRAFKDIPKVDLRYGKKAFDAHSEDVKPVAEELMGYGKEILAYLTKKVHSTDFDSFEKQVKDGYYTSNALIKTTLSFMKNFAEKKRDAGIIDFTDMEHMALEILIDKETGEPTDTAKRYREFFDEVMIDEYQDSNDVQETILSVVSRHDDSIGNRFMVGDIKQSIYGFRLAKPEIFREKCEKYSKDEEARDVRINLSHNFRSRSEVIDSVNFIFERCMKASVGEVKYDEDERLNLGKTDYPESRSNNKAEFMYFLESQRKENENTSDLNNVEFEARMVAQRIKELKAANTEVYDVKEDRMRPMKYSDIAILSRALSSNKDIIFQNALKEAGIPAYVISKTGYYNSREVQLILNLLSIIDNPRQDIPLAGVMMGCFGSFDASEMVFVRSHASEGDLYDSLKEAAADEGNKELAAKCKAFINMLEGYRERSAYTPIHELVDRIIL